MACVGARLPECCESTTVKKKSKNEESFEFKRRIEASAAHRHAHAKTLNRDYTKIKYRKHGGGDSRYTCKRRGEGGEVILERHRTQA